MINSQGGKFLFSKFYMGSQLRPQDQHGRSPMSAAAEYGNLDIVRMLLEAKSDKDLMDQPSRSPVTSLDGGKRCDVTIHNSWKFMVVSY